MKRITIKDVAREAGVSITTVSHALSGQGVMKQETRDRVIEIAHKMQYMPDWNGRNLKASETGVVGFFASSIRGYYGILADVMYEECRKTGYEMEVFITDSGDSLLNILLSRRVDGAVILHNGFLERHEEILKDSELPTVFLDREIRTKYISSVLMDSYPAGRMAAEYLFSLGHRSLMMIRGADTFDGIERQKGFEDYLREQGHPLEADYLLNGNFDRWVAYGEMNRFLEKKLPLPDAIFAANDDSAFGCIKALTEAGYSVPADVSVLGCDDIELSQWYVPALSTICTHIADQGITAMNEIVDLIRKECSGKIQLIKGQIVERASCRKAE
ncbi:MAG: LacI family transcriptional regulator [Firmicutes bacterium]|nr:LacI family transcriptional regulator [Bacillota bacterium]